MSGSESPPPFVGPTDHHDPGYDCGRTGERNERPDAGDVVDDIVLLGTGILPLHPRPGPTAPVVGPARCQFLGGPQCGRLVGRDVGQRPRAHGHGVAVDERR